MSRSIEPSLLTVGRFADIVELSVKMLRHYDRIGLLRPAYVDPATGYRYYRAEQAQTAELVRLLRDLDMPLAEIQALVEHPQGAEMQRRLREHRTAMARRRDEAARIVARLDRALDGGCGLMRYEVRLTDIEPRRVISRRERTSLAELDATILRLIGELESMAASHGIRTGEREIVLYHNAIERLHGHDVEVCVPVARDGSERRAGSWELPGGPAATVLHRGPWEDIRSAYVAVFSWIVEHGYEMAGPVREEYLADERDDATPLEYLTAITWPLMPPAL